MKLVATESILPGTKLARPIYNQTGQVLVNAGVALTARMVERLADMAITYLYIEDEQTRDITIKEPIREQVRREALTTIEQTFDAFKNSAEMDRFFVVEKQGQQLKALIHTILHELKSHEDLLNIFTEVFVHDNYIFTHSLNVTLYSLAIAMELKLPDKQLELIGLGAILHDIGKVIVPLEILSKPGRLTTEEYDKIKEHPRCGFDMLRSIPNIPLLVAHCAFGHHERLDGTGYPRGIKGDDIHLFAKIIAVADVFDAVTSNRVYRRAMLPHEGLEILYAGSGTQYDAKVVDAFRKSVAIYPNGLSVVLNHELKGVVARQNIGLSNRPVIRILEKSGVTLPSPYEMDLKEKLDMMIVDCDTTLVGKLHNGVGPSNGS